MIEIVTYTRQVENAQLKIWNNWLAAGGGVGTVWLLDLEGR